MSRGKKKATKEAKEEEAKGRAHLQGLLDNLGRTPARATGALPPAAAKLLTMLTATTTATAAQAPPSGQEARTTRRAEVGDAVTVAAHPTPTETMAWPVLAAKDAADADRRAAGKKTTTRAAGEKTTTRRSGKWTSAGVKAGRQSRHKPGSSVAASESYNLRTEGVNRAEAQKYVHRTIANTPAMLHTVRSVGRVPAGIRVDMHAGKRLNKTHRDMLQRAANKGSTVPRRSGPSGGPTQYNPRFSGQSRRRAESYQAARRDQTGSGRRKTVRRASVRRGNKTRRRRARRHTVRLGRSH